MNEKLSAFLDNEATRDEADSVVNELLRDESLRDSWTRQYWIRATLRAGDSEPAVVTDIDFSKRVMAAIDDEQPAHEQPRSHKVVSMHQRSRRFRRWRGIGGLAAAASVAGIVMLSGNPFVGTETVSETHLTANTSGATVRSQSQANASEQNDFSGEWNDRLADFSFMSSQHQPQARTVAAGNTTTGEAGQWNVSDPAVRDELNGYLADHNGMAGGYGMYRTTPALVRVAAYNHGVVTQ